MDRCPSDVEGPGRCDLRNACDPGAAIRLVMPSLDRAPASDANVTQVTAADTGAAMFALTQGFERELRRIVAAMRWDAR